MFSHFPGAHELRMKKLLFLAIVAAAIGLLGSPVSAQSAAGSPRKTSEPYTGDLSIFESGAILLHLGELSDKLMLASVEAASQPWSFFMFSGDTDETPMRKFFDSFLEARVTVTLH